MQKLALNVAIALSLIALVLVVAFDCALVWRYGSPDAPQQEQDIPIVYDRMAYTLVIEEPTGRSWREYADGSIEIITERTRWD